jgi:hypothetical protein
VSISAADEGLYDREETLHRQYEQDISPTAPAQLMVFRSYMTSSISEKTSLKEVDDLFSIKFVQFHQPSQMHSCVVYF